MTDAVIRTTARYQDLPGSSSIPAIKVERRNEFDQRVSELRAKLERGRENPFKPHTKIYNAVNPIVEQYKQFGSASSSRPSTPAIAVTGANSSSLDSSNSQQPAPSDKKRLSANRNSSNPSKQSGACCWRRLCCCCCCCCKSKCCSKKRPKIQSVESPSGERKFSSLNSIQIEYQNKQQQQTTNCKNDKKRASGTDLSLYSGKRASDATSCKSKEELHAKRIEFIKNLNAALSLKEQNKTNVLYNLTLPANYTPTLTSFSDSQQLNKAASATSNKQITSAELDNKENNNSKPKRRKKRFVCC